MTNFTEKFDSLRAQKERANVLPYKEQSVLMLLACGGAVFEEDHEDYDIPDKWHFDHDLINYYGAHVNIKSDLTLELIQNFTNGYVINWDKTEEATYGVGAGFNGTFTNTQLDVSYLYSHLWLQKNKDLKHYVIAVKVDCDFGALVRFISDTKFTTDECIEFLTDRATKHNSRYFSYESNIPPRTYQ